MKNAHVAGMVEGERVLALEVVPVLMTVDNFRRGGREWIGPVRGWGDCEVIVDVDVDVEVCCDESIEEWV